jgi:hypothetical protein
MSRHDGGGHDRLSTLSTVRRTVFCTTADTTAVITKAAPVRKTNIAAD